MKVGPDQFRYRLLLPSFRRWCPRFLPRAGSLHLQETALVLEGDLQRLFMPFGDLLFRRLLSERATITVPYSRILRCSYRPKLWARIVVTVLLWLPVVLPMLSVPDWDEDSFWRMELPLFGFAALMLTIYFTCWRFLARYEVVYHRANGKHAIVAFRFRSRDVQTAFAKLLDANCAAASKRPMQDSAPATRPSHPPARTKRPGRERGS